MALTANEKDLLALVARNPDEAAWRERYRELGLRHHDSTQAVVTTEIRKLRESPEGSTYLEQQRAEVEQNRVDAMGAADAAGWDREAARAKLDETIFKLATVKAEDQIAKIEGKDVKADSSSQVARLVEVGQKLTGTKSEGKQVTTEDRLLNARRAGIIVDDEVEPEWPPEHVAEVKAS